MEEHAGTQTGLAGALLAGSALLAAVLMLHHPSGEDHASLMTPIVHGGLQGLLMVQLAMAAWILRDQGWTLLAILGLVFFAAGQFAAIGAATINGFVVPAVMAEGYGSLEPGIGRFAWEFNQALARFGVITVGSGIAVFAAFYWGVGARILSGTGVAIGVLTAGAIVSGLLTMNLHGAMIVYVSQSAWLVFWGVWVFRYSRGEASDQPSG